MFRPDDPHEPERRIVRTEASPVGMAPIVYSEPLETWTDPERCDLAATDQALTSAMLHAGAGCTHRRSR